MLVRFFKSNQLQSALLAPIIALLLWLYSFMHPVAYVPTGAEMPLFKLIWFVFKPMSAFWQSFFAFLMILGQAYFLNFILLKHEYYYKRSNIPLLVYPLLCSILGLFQHLQAMLFVNWILLFVLNNTFQYYKSNKPLTLVFDTFSLLSLATLIYWPIIWILLWQFVALLVLRTFAWREWIAGLVGLVLPYFFVFLIYFWNEELQLLQYLLASNSFFTFVIKINHFGSKHIAALILGIILLIALAKTQANFYKNTIRVRSYQQTLFFLIVSLFPAVLFYPLSQPFNFLLFAIPSAIFGGYLLLSIKHALIAELVLATIFTAYFLNQGYSGM